ncbi:MAG: hypothetical protein ACPG4I_05945 [Candidatus Puniceispirillaceae bacterium]
MVRLAIFILRHILSAGQLKISLPCQPDIVVMPRRHYQNAEKPQSDRQVTIAIGLPSPSALLALVLRPDPLFGEYYMRGDLILKEGSFEDFVHFLFQICAWHGIPDSTGQTHRGCAADQRLYQPR